MVVRIPSPTFLSALDEELFFFGLRLVGSVRSYDGVGRFLEVRLDPGATKGDERDLAALFVRYRVEPEPSRAVVSNRDPSAARRSVRRS
jgi:hypothetical protein